MEERPRLAQVLQHYRDARGLSLDRLATVSGLPRSTVYRWLRGRVVSPYYWDHVVRLALALRLTRTQTNHLLNAAGMPPLHRLAEEAEDDGKRALLAHWPMPERLRLPANLTSFVGREMEAQAVAELLADDRVRLVTLTGAGGSGKTRLALQVAVDVSDLFLDGVFFVPLVNVTDPAQVMPTIARTLEIKESPGVSPLGRMAEALAGQRILLVLDNLEQVVDAGVELVEMLATLGGVKVLATSRTPLLVSGEHERPVAPLQPPARDATVDVNNPAISLFAQRARAVNPDFTLTPAVAEAVAEICRRVDGLPLAIELAAARCRTIAPHALLTAFPSLLDLAGDGPRDAPARHRTLRGTIAWSVDLLGPQEQTIFTRLAVFASGESDAGGWSVDAAEAVCRLPEETFDVYQALTAIESVQLIEPLSPRDGTHRCRMLEVIREYAAEQFAEQPEAETIREQHARYYLGRIDRSGEYIPQTYHEPWMEGAEWEMANHRAALAWTEAQADPTLFLRYVAAFWPFWHEYGYLREGSDWLRRALARRTRRSAHRRDLARILMGIFVLEYALGEFTFAGKAGEQALRLWIKLGDPYGVAMIRQHQGWADYISGNVTRALAHLRAALEAWREVPDHPAAIARCLGDLALVLFTHGQMDQARGYAQEALDIYERIDNRIGLARVYCDMGVASFFSGDIEGALEILERSLHLSREGRPNYITPAAQLYFGTVLCFAGRVEEGLPHLSGSMRTRLAIGDRVGMSYNLLGYVAAAHRLGDGEKNGNGYLVIAAQLCGATIAVQDATGIVMVPVVRAVFEQEMAAIRSALGPDTFDHAFRQGWNLPLRDAVRLALSVENVEKNG